MYTSTFLATLVLPAALAVGPWQQCGGINYSGDKVCDSGNSCVVINDYYWQCQPGVAAPTSSSVAAPAPAPTTTTGSKPPATTVATATGPSASGVGPGMTLVTGYYWIRAVADPNFHKYLQTKPVYTTGLAILDSYTTAGQFQIVDGQLVQLIDSKGTLLYANVTPQTDSSNTKLAVTFKTTKNTYGAFKWSGDALQWSISTITRPNESAWLVCANQQLFINLGSYGYMTPAGCSDQTIHYYNDKTPNS